MDLKIFLGLFATALALAAYIPIYWGIFFGTIRPHIYTYFVWTVTVGIAFFASVVSGGAAGAWSLGVTTILVVGIFLLCFKYGTQDVTKSDKWVLALAVISIIPWLLTKNPVISVVFVTLIESLSFIPTLRKTWNDPYSESYWPWVINVIKHSSIIFAVSIYSISTVLYPASLILMNLLLAAEIIVRRKTTKHA
jgi:hypothetical protein